MMKKILYIYLVLFLVLVSGVFAIDIQVKINETSTMTKLLSGGNSIDATGTLSIYNPSNVSKVFEFDLPLNLDSLIGISKVSNSTPTSSRFDFNYNRIKGYLINPGETISTKYRVYGLLSSDIRNETSNINKSFLQYYIGDFDFSTNIILNLQKPQREGFIHNDDANLSINSSPITNTTRLVSAQIKNPSDFNFSVSNISLYRSKSSDPFFKESDLIGVKSNLSLSPFESTKSDFFDYNSNDYSVYWLSSIFSIDYLLFPTINFNYKIQSPPSSSNGGSHGGGSGGGSYIIKDKKLDSILVKKSVDKTIVTNGDEFQVILRIININDFPLDNLVLKDVIPANYELKKASNEVTINNSELNFKIDNVTSYGTYIITYSLVNKNSLKGITYLEPAELFVKNQTFFSDGVLVINDLLGNSKVFVQKQIDIVDDKYSRVTIKVKNLGNVNLKDLLVVDNIADNAILKDISKVFQERGTWKIKSLGAGEQWEVSYLTETSDNLDSLPNVFGVEKSDVFGTIVTSNQVTTVYGNEPRTIEKVGMGIAASLLVFYLLF